MPVRVYAGSTSVCPDASFDEVLAALHRTSAVFGSGLSNSVDATITLAGVSSDPHVIKLCEAAVREFGEDSRPEFPAAARAWSNGGT